MKSLIFLFLVLSIVETSAQNFGTDKLVFDNPNVELDEIFLQSSFNGWKYVGYNYYDMPYRGYRVELSTDNGLSWQTLIDFSVPGASGWYPQIVDMLVAGTDTSNLRVYLALLGNGNAGPKNFGTVETFSGTIGTSIGTAIEIGDFMTYNVHGIALSSDNRHPLMQSNPYSVVVAYSAADSLNTFYSDDGGLTFTHVPISTDTMGYRDLDISYGSFQNPAIGKFGISYSLGTNIGVFLWDFTFPMISNVSIIDTVHTYSAGRSRKPVIMMQSSDYGNSSSSYSLFVVASLNDTVDNSTDIILFSYDTLNSGSWIMEVIDSTLNVKKTPSLAFSEMDSTFLLTYYDSTANELPLLRHGMDFPGPWTRTAYDYPDTLKFLKPFPQVDASGTLSCIWKQRGDTTSMPFLPESIKYDELTLPVSVSQIDRENLSFTIFPNPAFGQATIKLKDGYGKYKVSIVNSIGEIIYSKDIEFANEFSLPKISNGIYSVLVENEQGRGIARFVQSN